MILYDFFLYFDLNQCNQTNLFLEYLPVVLSRHFIFCSRVCNIYSLDTGVTSWNVACTSARQIFLLLQKVAPATDARALVILRHFTYAANLKCNSTLTSIFVDTSSFHLDYFGKLGPALTFTLAGGWNTRLFI